MGYRALLFCPDEKTARTVMQVLNELEFTVEACAEPFAAVKKLMGEHFDAVAVDCDNEQNATLVFKSARNSNSNHASLAIAVVEGQAGVAKAFRIGANLVLTKPINVEQAKGTLRVARGLLRKGEASKPVAAAEIAAPSAQTTAPTAPAKMTVSAPVVKPTAAEPSITAMPTPPAAARAPWGKIPSAPAPSVTASSDDDPLSELNERKEESAARATPPEMSKAAAASVRSIAQPPAKPAVEKTSLTSAAITPASAPGFGTGNMNSVSAPAKATDERKEDEALLSKIARVSGPTHSVEARNNETSEVPELDGITGKSEKKSTSERSITIPFQAQAEAAQSGSGSKKFLLGAVAAVLLAVATYCGWAFLNGKKAGSAEARPQPVKQLPAGSAAVTASAPRATPATAVSASPVSTSFLQQDSKHSPSTEQTASNAESKVTQPQDSEASVLVHKTAQTSGDAATSASHPLVVKQGKTSSALKLTSTDTAAPSMMVAGTGSGSALPTLVGGSAAEPTPVLQSMTVSQGVSQGLVIKRVQPSYPQSAMHLHLEGSVHLLATIGKNGSITAVKTLSGEPLLVQAAKDAVKQWKYKPYLLNGEPIEIQTQVTINFQLPK